MTHTRKIFRLLLLLSLAFTASCNNEDDDIQLGGGGTPAQPPTSLSARMEVPQPLDGNLLVAHWSVENGDSVMAYCLEYSPEDYHSRWVAFRFDGRTRAKKVGRKDYSIRPQYPRDPLLPTTVNALTDDASFNGYQHGHLCASADRLYSRTANDATFYMTNMSPQKGNFNSPYWSEYEALVQKLGRDASFADTLYIVKGGTITAGMTLGRVAGGKIVVPKYYYMALLKVKNGAYNAIAFWMEHKDYGKAKPLADEMRGKTTSINRIEELTGIDFFPNLPDEIEEAVEERCMPSSWGL